MVEEGGTIHSICDISDTSSLPIPDSTEATVTVNLDIINNTEDIIEETPCQLCQEARKSRTPHICRVCGNVVCNFCSKQDPDSDNEMHRVHSNLSQCSATFESSLTVFACPHCDEILTTTKDLNNHIQAKHPQGFESIASLSQIAKELEDNTNTTLDETEAQAKENIKCTECEKLFYHESDAKHHNVRVHEYGEPYNLYPCELCGFSGSDVIEIEEHIKNHKKEEQAGKTLSDEDEDEEWKKSVEDEKLLMEDTEDEFMYSCERCKYETIWEDQLAKHIKWQHSNEIREERRNKRKAIEEAKSKEKRMKSNENNKSQDDVKAKIKSMMGKGETMGKKQRNSLCKVCGKEGNWTSIKKHIEVHHLRV